LIDSENDVKNRWNSAAMKRIANNKTSYLSPELIKKQSGIKRSYNSFDYDESFSVIKLKKDDDKNECDNTIMEAMQEIENYDKDDSDDIVISDPDHYRNYDANKSFLPSRFEKEKTSSNSGIPTSNYKIHRLSSTTPPSSSSSLTNREEQVYTNNPTTYSYDVLNTSAQQIYVMISVSFPDVKLLKLADLVIKSFNLCHQEKPEFLMNTNEEISTAIRSHALDNNTSMSIPEISSDIKLQTNTNISDSDYLYSASLTGGSDAIQSSLISLHLNDVKFPNIRIDTGGIQSKYVKYLSNQTLEPNESKHLLDIPEKIINTNSTSSSCVAESSRSIISFDSILNNNALTSDESLVNKVIDLSEVNRKEKDGVIPLTDFSAIQFEGINSTGRRWIVYITYIYYIFVLR
jgi:hypothetical protein